MFIVWLVICSQSSGPSKFKSTEVFCGHNIPGIWYLTCEVCLIIFPQNYLWHRLEKPSLLPAENTKAFRENKTKPGDQVPRTPESHCGGSGTLVSWRPLLALGSITPTPIPTQSKEEPDFPAFQRQLALPTNTNINKPLLFWGLSHREPKVFSLEVHAVFSGRQGSSSSPGLSS